MMGTLSPGEEALLDMHPTWAKLVPVRAFEDALRQFLREELPAGHRTLTAPGLTAAYTLIAEFREMIWPHRVPDTVELLRADQAGQLDEKIKELNEAFARGE